MYKRALVPLDGSPLAESIIPILTKIAGPLDMSLVFLRVVEPVPSIVGDGTMPVVVEDLETRVREAEEYLAPLAAMLRARGIDASWSIRRGRVEDEILAAAQDDGADLIAMSTHGRSGLGRLLFGSVAEQVLRRAGVPVFMIRETKERRIAGTADQSAVRAQQLQTGSAALL